MNFHHSNVITLQYCDWVAAPITESGVLNEAEWTLPEAEFHDRHVQREMLVSSVSYWVIRSNDDRHFSFEELSYDRLVIIMGRGAVDWHATKQGDDSVCLSGRVVLSFGQLGSFYQALYEGGTVVEQFETILELIRASMFYEFGLF